MTSDLFEGQVVVVTGAAHGMGAEYSRAFARAGASVLACDVAQEPLDEVLGEIASEGGTAVGCTASVSVPEGAREMVQTAVERFGTVDAVINNAGIMRNGYLEDLDAERLDSVIAVHVRGSFLLTQAAWPVMREKGYGRVVMIGSAGAMYSQQGVSNYAAAKGGVYGLCRALSVEGEEHGILVNTVMPMAGTMSAIDKPVPGYADRYPQALRTALAPRRVVAAVAPLTMFLASRACELTGEAFSVGFGRYARVFVGEAPGWVADDPADVSVQDVIDHLEQIRDIDGFVIPRNIYENAEAIGRFVGVDQSGVAAPAG